MDAGGPGEGTREGPGSPTSAGLSGPPADAVFASAGVTWRSGGVGGHDDVGMLAPHNARVQCKHAPR